MLLKGAFDTTGSPTLRVTIAGPVSAQEYVATIDTGFTGFVALPLTELATLGLKTESAAKVTLGDGSVVEDLVAQGSVALADKREAGAILVSDSKSSKDILIGMDFLRKFKLALIVTPTIVLLYDEAETLPAVMRIIRNAPVGQPNTGPSSN